MLRSIGNINKAFKGEATHLAAGTQSVLQGPSFDLKRRSDDL